MTTTPVAIRIPLLAALVLLVNPCQAFLLPSGRIRRPTFTTSGLRLWASSPKHLPRMSFTGFPSEGGKRAWDEDLPTTVGRVVFSSFKDKARDMMVKGVEKRGLDWTGIVESLQGAQNWEKLRTEILANSNVVVPEYYLKQFHAYGDGNLCWQAAFEQEIASMAVGIRSFPKEGVNAEKFLRDAFITQLTRLGGQVEKGGTVVDFGCGVGTSTRVLAESMPEARRVVGIDLSPHMIAVGNHHNKERKVDRKRVSLVYGDVADSRLSEGSASLVSCTYLLHEMPRDAIRDTLKEAYRLLKPGGSLAIMDMDPDAPGYKSLRSNPFLFAIVRATEPYLDQWFGIAPSIHQVLADVGFSVVRKAAVTGRHFLVVATKAGSLDFRPSDNARAAMDEHLSTWET